MYIYRYVISKITEKMLNKKTQSENIFQQRLKDSAMFIFDQFVIVHFLFSISAA